MTPDAGKLADQIERGMVSSGYSLNRDEAKAVISLLRHSPGTATREEVAREGSNGCILVAAKALDYLADHVRPAGGQESYNAEHLIQLAYELRETALSPPSDGRVREALEGVLAYEKEKAVHSGLSDCTCMGWSRASENAYEAGCCPHQKAHAALRSVTAEQRGEPYETCGACMGSGYGGHPDSGDTCHMCNGDGVVFGPSEAPPVPENLASLIKEYARDLRRNSSGGDDYPWEWAKATADYLEALIARSADERNFPGAALAEPLIAAADLGGSDVRPNRELDSPDRGQVLPNIVRILTRNFWTGEPGEKEAIKSAAEELRSLVTPPVPDRAAWQPIETAPKDGTKILLKFPKPFLDMKEDGIAVGCWTGNSDSWWLSCIWASSNAHRQPTRWCAITPPNCAKAEDA